MKKSNKKTDWSAQEVELLTHSYSQFNSKRWKRIAELFAEKGFQRTQIECREKWINFLDPSLNKNEWEQWELEKLYEIHEHYGTRWCLVQRFIGRTQNKIKNRFYGTLRNFIRFVANSFDRDGVCFNEKISKLSPKFLNQMYKGQNEFQFTGGEIKKAIYAMRFRIDKKLLAERMREQKKLYEKLSTVIFGSFELLAEKKIENNIIKQEFQEVQDSSRESQREATAKTYPFLKSGIYPPPDDLVGSLNSYMQASFWHLMALQKSGYFWNGF